MPQEPKGLFGAVDRVFGVLVTAILICLVALTLYTTGIGLVDAVAQRSSVVAASLVICIVSSSWLRNRDKLNGTPVRNFLHISADIGLLVIGLFACWQAYAVITATQDTIYELTEFDAFISVLGIFVVLEMCRRIWGWALFIVAALAVIYLVFGKDLPWIFQHTGVDIFEVADNLWYNTNKSVFGSITSVIISIVFIFLIFGSLLESSGAGPTLLKFAFIVTRRLRGGPAHAAILASSLFGTMSGSPTANIVGTGTFTIPMIIKRGFSRTFAAGIEATASCGGQIMPPIMGAAALVMADQTGISYLTIIVAALIPALLYYFSLFTSVVVEARRQGIKPEPLAVEDRITRQDIVNSIMFIVPISTVIGALILGYSTAYAGFLATIALVLVSVINPEVRRDPMRLISGMMRGANNGARLMMAIAAIGLIVGTIDSTGLGLKLATVMGAIRGESLIAALFMAMAGALVLGMGMPTLPAYLIIILILGPALQHLGTAVLTAHMFVFYYGVASSLTPPVAIAAYAAAPIANANPFNTSIMALRLGAAKFVIPFAFAFYPELLVVLGFETTDLLWNLLRVICAVWLISTALSGYEIIRMNVVEIALRLTCAIGLLVTDAYIYTASLIVGAALLGVHYLRSRRAADKASIS